MHQLRLVLVALLLATTGLYAQEGFYYQAVIKNTDGSPLKESEIRIRIRIIEGETTLQFEEEKTITTSREGFVSFIIGESKPDEFATINWQGELYLQDEIDTGEGYGAPTKMPLLKTPRSYISDRAISVLDNSITSASILDQTILTEDLADNSITNEKLADSLITSNKIAKGAVVKEAIATGSINTEAVIDSTLTNIDISPDAAIDISKINIPDGSITLEKINLEDGIINYSKLNVADGEIPFSKILIENEEIPFEKLNITQENINGLGIVSNYTGGSNLSITETTIDLDDEINLAKVTADLTGDIYNADSERVLEVGTTDNAAIYTGNVTGNLTGNLIGGGGRTVLANGNNTTLAKYFGDMYYRENDGTETQLIDSKNKIFFGTFKGNLEGSWEGNVIGQGNEVVLDPVTEDGSALFTGNVIGNLTGDIVATDITTTNLEATDITASGTITGNVEGNLVGDVTATDIVASGTITGNLTGDVTGDILADDGTITLNNGDTKTNSTFAGNAATASTLSQTLSIEKGGTGATSAPMIGVITAADADEARTLLSAASSTDNTTDVTLAGQDFLSINEQTITANKIDLTDDVTETLPIANGGTGAVSAPMIGVITAADADEARTLLSAASSTDNTTDVTLAGQDFLSINEQTITANKIDLTDDVTETLPIANGGTGAVSAPMIGVITAADADEARTLLSAASSTDNTTDVTLAGQDFLSINEQTITANKIDLTDDVTETLPIANGGTGAVSAPMIGVITAANAAAARVELDIITGTFNWSNSPSNFEVINITGVTASSIVTISMNGEGNNQFIRYVKPEAGKITIQLNGDPGDGTKFSYFIIP